MGGVFSKSPQSPPPLFGNPWRAIDWGAKDEFLTYVRNYKPEGASHVRVLLYGPVASGKSSFTNSVGSAILGRPVNVAEANTSNSTTSFTLQYKTHRFKIKAGEKRGIPIVFNDTVGLEPRESRGVRPEDIKLVMEGHVKDGYKFKPAQALSQDDAFYNPKPSIDDKVHVLVCMLNANSTDINPDVLLKMKEVRETARDLGIPQVVVVTHIDQLCGEIKTDVKKVFRSNVLKEKMDYISASLGVIVKYIFPVWNNYEGLHKDAVDTLILTAVRQILDFGDDFIDVHC